MSKCGACGAWQDEWGTWHGSCPTCNITVDGKLKLEAEVERLRELLADVKQWLEEDGSAGCMSVAAALAYRLEADR